MLFTVLESLTIVQRNDRGEVQGQITSSLRAASAFNRRSSIPGTSREEADNAV